jgi:hypothetical protein
MKGGSVVGDEADVFIKLRLLQSIKRFVGHDQY